MTNMSVTAGTGAAFIVHPLRLAQSVRRPVSPPGIGTQASSRHLMQAADATMRFVLALMPFSTLVWVFVAH